MSKKSRVNKKKAVKNKATTTPIGFLPCFTDYLYRDYPVDRLYVKSANLKKFKDLLVALVESPDILTLKAKTGQEIKAIRPDDDSRSYKIIIAQCKYPRQLYRIDYGNTPFRIVFGLESEPFLKAPVFIVDTNHETCSDKNRKPPKGGGHWQIKKA